MLVAVECTKSKKRTLCVSYFAVDAGRFVYYRKNLNSILKYQKIDATIVLVINLQAATMVYSVEYYLFLSTIGGVLWSAKKIK